MSCYVIHVLMLCAYVMHAVCSRLHVRLRLRLCYVVLCLVELCYVMYLISCYVMLSYLMLFKCYHCFTTLSCADMPAASSIRNIHTQKDKHTHPSTRIEIYPQLHTNPLKLHAYTTRMQTNAYVSICWERHADRERKTAKERLRGFSCLQGQHTGVDVDAIGVGVGLRAVIERVRQRRMYTSVSSISCRLLRLSRRE